MSWRAPTAHPILEPDRVHAWRINQASLWPGEAAHWQVLSEVEKSRADRFVFASDRSNFIAARWALRTILAQYLQEEPKDLPIEDSPFGKPYTRKLLNNKHLKFNLSHSHGLCVAVFSLGKELGVDIESVRSDVAFDDLATRYFSSAENEALRRLDPALRELAFWCTWTRKEAYVKARGEGLQIPLDSFTVSVGPSEGEPVLKSQDQERWVVRSFAAQDNWVGACVIESPVKCLEFWNFTVEHWDVSSRDY